ncbi:hypothetical protein [Undibacterium sp.]|uniref:hypothetical protein n=1 Tax=Undibacterium sp. TaxID=1914977 RepID=UPI00272B6F7B|nr:hypothetical protein [Undibacterium sp.]
MIEIKRRFRAIDRIIDTKKSFTKNEDIDNESAFLQVRKIVELITFSAIISDEQRYKKSRELDALENPKVKGDFTLDWNAADILIRLSKISTHFLPKPLNEMITQENEVKHFNEATAKATHDRLISIYKTASGFAHISNPYKSNFLESEKKKKETARFTLEKEVRYLKSIIWEHVKIGLVWQSSSHPNQPEQAETAWLVWFGEKGNDKIEMELASAA